MGTEEEGILRVISYRQSNMKFLICYLLCLQTTQLKNCRLGLSPTLDKSDAPHIKTRQVFPYC